MEAAPPPKCPTPRRFSVAMATTSYNPSPSMRHLSAFRPPAMGHEGTMRYSSSPSPPSCSSSPPRSSSPDDRGSEASSRSAQGKARLKDHHFLHHQQQNSRKTTGERPDEDREEARRRGGRRAEPGPRDPKLRQRTLSLPATHAQTLRPVRFGASSATAAAMMLPAESGPNPWRDVYTCPVRSFSRTTKGVVSRGDSMRKCSLSSLLSSASSSTVTDLEERQRAMSIVSQDSVQGQGQSQGQGQGVCGGVVVDGGAEGALAPAYYRVAVLGTVEVGKSALCRQFMSSEYLGTYGDSFGESWAVLSQCSSYEVCSCVSVLEFVWCVSVYVLEIERESFESLDLFFYF